MIAVCLLTCGRAELTERTVDSFNDQNANRSDLIRLWADGGPRDEASFANSVHATYFRPVHLPDVRVPQMVSYRHLIEEAGLKGAEFILWLENDWESVAPIPSIDFLHTAREEDKIDTFRLFGVRRMRGPGDSGIVRTTQIGTDKPIDWQPSKYPGWEFGHAHWGGGGTITTLEFLESQYHRRRLKDVVTARPDLRTLRLMDNAMWHIGETSTPGLH